MWHRKLMPGRRPPCLLLSGGVDSALVGQLLLEAGSQPTALFVNYGQPAAQAEVQASQAVARHLGLVHHQLTMKGLDVPDQGEIGGRNDLLIAAAQAAAPGCDVAIGIHAGTGYPDCSPQHHAAWQALLDVQHGGAVRVLAPLLLMSKGAIFRLAAAAGLPLSATHSCETSNMPCKQCSSCRDRAEIDAAA